MVHTGWDGGLRLGWNDEGRGGPLRVGWWSEARVEQAMRGEVVHSG